MTQMRWPFITRARYEDLKAQLAEVKAERDRLLALFVPQPAAEAGAPGTESQEKEADPKEGLLQFGQARRPSIVARHLSQRLAQQHRRESATALLATMHKEAVAQAAAIQGATARENAEKKSDEGAA